MGIFDEAKNLAEQHPDQVKQGLDQAGQFVNDQTGGKFQNQINQGEQAVEGQLGGGQGQPQDPNAQQGQPQDPNAQPNQG